jgi:hypothetical protein
LYSTEVLEAIGFIDMDEIVSDESTQSMKQRALGSLSGIKNAIRDFDLKEMVEDPKQKSGALGAAAGALVGFLM